MKNSLIGALLILVGVAQIQAQIPRTLSYQGILSDTSGIPKPDGVYGMTFRIYPVSQSGSPLWSETQAVGTRRGLFSTVLGDISPFPDTLRFDRRYWLGIQVSPDPELTPRIQLTATGYSIRSRIADTAQYARTAPGSSFADSSRIAGTVPDNSIMSGKITSGQVVKSLNNLHDAVTLRAQGGATITSDGDTITINSGAGGGGTGIQGIQNTDNALTITNPIGPTATVNVRTPLQLNGNVGIGAISATERLTVGGASSADTKIEIDAGGNQYAGLRIKNSQRRWNWQVVPSNDSPGGRLRLTEEVGNAERMTITEAGNVGIGTTDPSGKLVVIGGIVGGVTGSSTSRFGVSGTSTSGVGLSGTSTSYFGVVGESGNAAGVYGFGTEVGVLGHSLGSSTNSVGVEAYAQNGTAISCGGKFFQQSGIFEAHPTSTVWSTNKPATVKLNDGTSIKLFSEEAAEIYFNDYGEGQLVNGRTHIELDPIFLQTVTIDERHPIKVFVQEAGECNGMYFTNRTSTGFDVAELHNGSSNAPFVYRVVCKRKYYEDERLATQDEDIKYNAHLLQAAWPEVLGKAEEEKVKVERMVRSHRDRHETKH